MSIQQSTDQCMKVKKLHKAGERTPKGLEGTVPATISQTGKPHSSRGTGSSSKKSPD